jgi:hypothetical protein
MKYLILARKFGTQERGSYVISKRFQKLFPYQVDFLESRGTIDWDQISEKYKKIIFITQVPKAYKVPVNIISLRNINHLIYIRDEYNHSLFNSCSNGFYYYLDHKSIKNYIPTMMPFDIESRRLTRPCLGFYERKDITMDSYKWFTDFLAECKHEIDVYLMGNPPYSDFTKRFDCVQNFNHTYDNERFFSSISHYVFPASKIYVDPFPNTILEAVQTGKQLIIPTIPDRSHRDGVDDIKECVKYHTTFNPDVYYDNSNTMLKSENFDKFLKNVLENDFEYHLDRDKYKSFSEWIEKEVI